jgi:predicted HTH domain antitoxin
MRVAAAVLWYAQGQISQSRGATIAGLSRAEFIDALAQRRVSVMQATLEEVEDEAQRG